MLTSAEIVAAASLFALLIAFKTVNIMRYRFDSDEPQHLHVIWAWARGFVQYRDVFDNHMPLFQILFAPVFGLIGDRATILYWMRLILLPAYFASAWCTYRVGTLLFSRRVGVWAVILAGFYPNYHFGSLEFRTDTLWALFWLLCIVVLVSGRFTPGRALRAGVLLGFAFGVSVKTTLLLLCIGLAASVALLISGPKTLHLSPTQLTRSAVAFLAGTSIVPLIIITAFALAGIGRDFRYCVLEHNILPHFGNHSALSTVISLIMLPLIIYLARVIMRATPELAVACRRGFVFLVCGFYLVALYSSWSLISRQDFLPYHPLAFVFCSAALLAISGYVGGGKNRLQMWPWVPLPALVASVEFFVALGFAPFWVDGGKRETDLLRAVLQLTEPSDYVFDPKGETIFRQRCFRPVLESFTRERIQRGLLVDNVAESCIEKRACVAMPPRETVAEGARFITRNYLPIGNGLRVVGGLLQSSSADPNRFDFEVVVPASYKVMARDMPVTGVLDGEPYQGARFLGPGKHTFVQTSHQATLVLLWAQAVDRHFKYQKPSSDG